VKPNLSSLLETRDLLRCQAFGESKVLPPHQKKAQFTKEGTRDLIIFGLPQDPVTGDWSFWLGKSAERFVRKWGVPKSDSPFSKEMCCFIHPKLGDLTLFSVACLSHQLLQYSLLRHPLLQNHFREKGGLGLGSEDNPQVVSDV